MENIETEIIQTVSGGDAALDTENPVIIQDNITLEELTLLLESKQEEFVSALSTEMQELKWAEKPLEDLTVTEGCLVIITVLLLWLVIKQFIGGIFK